jgi:hypothetical protein
MKKKLCMMGMLACMLAFGIMMFASCDSLLHSCSNQSECNDGDTYYCGDSSCEASVNYGGYYYLCDGVCDGS